MNITVKKARVLGALVLSSALVSGLVGCTPATPSGSDAKGGTYTLWDPYPDRDAESTWAKAIDACATDLDITIERNAGNTGDTVKDLTTAASNLPDIAMVDNPKVSTLADAGLLTTTQENGLDVSDISKNILSAGEIDGDVYGVPVGANTLGLYYNPAVLDAAGVDIATVVDYDSLTAALKKVVAAGKKGITFSAVGTEEGTFQFLPWFWGAGADLTELDSSNAEARAHPLDRLGQDGHGAQLGHLEHAGDQLGRIQDGRIRLRGRTDRGSRLTQTRAASSRSRFPASTVESLPHRPVVSSSPSPYRRTPRATRPRRRS